MANQRFFAFLPQATVNTEKLNSLSSSTRWIYVVLVAERHGLDAPFRLSYKEIRKITHFSTSTIRIAIKALEAAGFLEYDHGGLEANPNVYTLEPSWLSLAKKYTGDTGSVIGEPPGKPKRKKLYPPEWTKGLRARIRNRDGHRCTECGEVKLLCVHHIDHDKQNCDEKNLITLCRRCHQKARGNGTSWEEDFYRGTLPNARLQQGAF